MNLELNQSTFLVTGSTSGLGRAVAGKLLEEGAQLIINARGEDRLLELSFQYPGRVQILSGDITTDACISDLGRLLHGRKIHGMVINASGPPVKSFEETNMEDWDQAYEKILRWKIKITKEFLGIFMAQKYGRLLFIESASVKQPVENLILSNAMRLAVVGFVKTLSQEIAHLGITANILAPGYHATPAMERLLAHKALLLGISPDEAKVYFEKEIKMGHLGNPDDFASLAAWLLSPHAGYITGQTIAVDGGLIKGTMG